MNRAGYIFCLLYGLLSFQLACKSQKHSLVSSKEQVQLRVSEDSIWLSSSSFSSSIKAKREECFALQINKLLEASIEKRADSLSQSDLLIFFEEGHYFFNNTLRIDGQKFKNIILKGKENSTITGAARIPNEWVKALSRHDFHIATHSWLDEITLAGARGFNKVKGPGPNFLLVQDEFIPINSHPQQGWLKISNLSGKDAFYFQDSLPFTQLDVSTTWAHGLWSRDWADSYVKVADLDFAKKKVVTEEPYGVYGYAKGGKFRFVNVPISGSQKGWFYNREQERIEVRLDETQEDPPLFYWAKSDQTAIFIKDAEEVSIQSLTFQGFREVPLRFNSIQSYQLQGLTFRNNIKYALDIQNGSHGNIDQCNFINLGEGAIRINGGNRETLLSSHQKIQNCQFVSTNLHLLNYQHSIWMDGVGIEVRNCSFTDQASGAIFLKGNDHKIYRNLFYNLGSQTGDHGAIYMGREWSMRGNEIKENIFYNIHSKFKLGASAIYLDDLFSGAQIERNLFMNVQCGVNLGGGKDNLIRDNYFQGCQMGVKVVTRSSTATNNEETLKKRLIKFDFEGQIWAEAYPELVGFLERPHLLKPSENEITGNDFRDCQEAIKIDRSASERNTVNNNSIEKNVSFRVEDQKVEKLFQQVGQLGMEKALEESGFKNR